MYQKFDCTDPHVLLYQNDAEYISRQTESYKILNIHNVFILNHIVTITIIVILSAKRSYKNLCRFLLSFFGVISLCSVNITYN